MENAPGQDLSERLELGDGNEDNNGLLSTTDVDLAGSRDLEGADLVLEIGDVVLDVNEGLCDHCFHLVG